MKTILHYTNCNGETVQLQHVQYGTASDYRNATLTPMPERTVKYATAYGGGLPAVYAYAIGKCPTCGNHHYSERMIERPSNASNHKCSARCQNATGKVCECSCRGKNHGAN